MGTPPRCLKTAEIEYTYVILLGSVIEAMDTIKVPDPFVAAATVQNRITRFALALMLLMPRCFG